jgi:ketosteroid isomerase-like protein
MEHLPDAVQRFLEGLESGDWTGMEQHLTPDVLYDGSMPGWRVQYEGPNRVAQEYREEWTGRHPWQVTDRHVTSAGDVVVVDFQATFTGPGHENHSPARELFRMASLFRLRDGQIYEHRYFCCGEWDEETIHRVETTAPKVEREVPA